MFFFLFAKYGCGVSGIFARISGDFCSDLLRLELELEWSKERTGVESDTKRKQLK